jgi:hypothetical protein
MYSKNIVFETPIYRGVSSPPATTLLDKSRYKNNGAITGATWTKKPNSIWNLYFDGNDYVKVPHNDCFNFVNKCSFSFWANFSSFPAPGNLRYVFDKGNLGASTGWMILIDGVNPYVSLLIGDGVSAPAAHSNVLVAGVWNHFVGTFEGRYEKMYQNGAWVHTMDFGAYITIANIATDLYIGCESAPGEYMIGYLESSRIWNIELSADDVLRLYTKERKQLFGA